VALVTFHVRSEFHEEKAKLLSQRRQAYKNADWRAYEDIVRDIYLKQEMLFNEMCEEIFDALDISKDVFIES